MVLYGFRWCGLVWFGGMVWWYGLVWLVMVWLVTKITEVNLVIANKVKQNQSIQLVMVIAIMNMKIEKEHH